MAGRNRLHRHPLAQRPTAAPALQAALLIGLSLIVLQLALASVAQANTFNWYGEGNTTCWQAGQPPVSSNTCDGVGEWFLNSSNPVRTREGALAGDLALTQSGDYCNSYNLNEGPFYTRDLNNEEGLTGFNPSPPDTMTDGHGSVCQGLGATWGQGLRPAAKATCGPCGMQHYVSFASQNGGLRPWSNAFAGPQLVIEAAAYPKTAKASYAWGYLCPLIEQVGSPNGDILEYCFVEWTKGWGLPPAEGQVLEEITPDGHDAVELRTDFALGTSFSTEIAGSGNSVFGEHTEPYPFKAAITEANLLAAIRAANTKHGMGFSESLSDYALIGVEQGTEENNSTAELGEKTEGLKLYTEFPHYQVAPGAATQEASEVHQTSAKINGSVNPEGSSTEAWFEYGTSASYGTKVPSGTGWPIGSGTTWIPAYEHLTGLKPGTTYHYRVVGQNAYGQKTVGADQTFTTASAPTIAFQANNDTLWTYSQAPNEGWGGWLNTSLGMKPGTSPSIAVSPGGGYEIAFQAGGGELWTYSSNGEYKNTGLGMKPGTSPAIAALSSGGYEIAFQANGGTLWTYFPEAGGGWRNTGLAMKAGTSPSIAASPSGGYQIAIQAQNGTNGELWTYSSNGEYKNTKLGMKPATSPSIAALSGGGYETAIQAINGSNGELWTYLSTGEYRNTALGMLASTSPTI